MPSFAFAKIPEVLFFICNGVANLAYGLVLVIKPGSVAFTSLAVTDHVEILVETEPVLLPVAEPPTVITPRFIAAGADKLK